MRRWSLTVPVLVIACGVLGFSAAPANAGAGDKLVVDSVTEPPDTQVRGGKWRLTVTVSNEGGERSTSDRIRWFLSRGRRFSEDDLQRRLSGTVNLPALNANRQATRRVTLGIPQTIQDGVYYLVTCLGRTAQNTDNLNCRFSGQTMRIGGAVQGGAQSQSAPGGPGGPGATGPQGPQGARGNDGLGIQVVQIPRTELAGGAPTIQDTIATTRGVADGTAGNFEEGGTTQDLVDVGPFTFRALCRDTPTAAGAPDEDVAKILAYHDDGTMALESDTGPRREVPAGTGEAGREDVRGGEGQHQVVTVERDFDDRITDGTAEGDSDGSGTNDGEGAFSAREAVLVHSSGWLVSLVGYVGIDTLGVGEIGPTNDDACVFGGSVTIWQQP